MNFIKVNNIFYTLQGEGAFTGTPMTFIRLAGCNLRCPFCDTSYDEYDEMNAFEVVEKALKVEPKAKYACITGGEPLLQDLELLTTYLHIHNYQVHLETNGTLPPSGEFDWVTLSPKGIKLNPLTLGEADVIKVLCSQEGPLVPLDLKAFRGKLVYLQPIQYPDPSLTQQALKKTVECVLENPNIRLSLQVHKLLKIL